jgi:hypothetical protein
MASPQADQHRHAQLTLTLSLLMVLLLAKALMLAGRPIAMSVWAPIAYSWQDVLLVAGFGLFTSLVPGRAVGMATYALIVGDAALNVPIARALGSPLTWTMISAARGPLADSIRHELTLASVASVGAVTAAGMILPRLVAQMPIVRPAAAAMARRRLAFEVPACALAVAVAGFWAAARLDTRGLDQNIAGALWPRGRLQTASALTTVPISWRTSPRPSRPTGSELPVESTDLTRLSGAAAGRNVVLVILESTAAQYLRVGVSRAGASAGATAGGGSDGGDDDGGGADADPMPHLTTLARDAVVFDAAYSVYPESIRGLFATLCGAYPAFDASAEVLASRPCTSLPSTLAHAAYDTALFHSGRFDYLGMRAVIDHRGFDTLEDAGAIGGVLESSFGVDEPSTVRRILTWFDQRSSRRPAFVAYLPIAGHHPYASPSVPIDRSDADTGDRRDAPRILEAPFRRDSDFHRYLNALHDADAALDTLVAGLQARSLWDRTLLIVMGDHGEAFGQHAGDYVHSSFLYEENVHVPFLIVAPVLITGTNRVGRVASVVDTTPTILDLLGVPAPPMPDASSLLRPDVRMALFFTDYAQRLAGLRDGCWAQVSGVDSTTSQLFDVCTDPGETRDLAAQYPADARAYRERLLQWVAAEQVVPQGSGREIAGRGSAP